MFGTIYHVSPEGVKHMDMLNNSFARCGIHMILRRANKFAPTYTTNILKTYIFLTRHSGMFLTGIHA